MIDVQEVEDLEVAIPFRDAKPSEILRSQPRDKWCAHYADNGEGKYCRMGWLLHIASREPQKMTNHEYVDSLLELYGIDRPLQAAVELANDSDREDADGFERSLRVLEEAGY